LPGGSAERSAHIELLRQFTHRAVRRRPAAAGSGPWSWSSKRSLCAGLGPPTRGRRPRWPHRERLPDAAPTPPWPRPVDAPGWGGGPGRLRANARCGARRADGTKALTLCPRAAPPGCAPGSAGASPAGRQMSCSGAHHQTTAQRWTCHGVVRRCT
jgi:hypothetical protein